MAPGFSSPESNIGFRVVQAPALKAASLPYVAPQFQQTAAEITRGPDPAKPYFHTRPLFPDLGGRDMRAVG